MQTKPNSTHTTPYMLEVNSRVYINGVDRTCRKGEMKSFQRDRSDDQHSFCGSSSSCPRPSTGNAPCWLPFSDDLAFRQGWPTGNSMNWWVNSDGFPTRWFVASQMAGFVSVHCYPALSLPVLHCTLVFHTWFLLSLVYLYLRAVSLLVCTSLGYSRYTLSFVEHRRDTHRVHEGGSFLTGSLSTAPADTSGSPPTHRSRLAVTRARGVSRGDALVWDGCADGRHITPATSMTEKRSGAESGTSS